MGVHKLIKILNWLLPLLALVGAANAQNLLGIMQANTGGGNPVPPSCSNSLDFSDQCNSQYLSLFKGMI